MFLNAASRDLEYEGLRPIGENWYACGKANGYRAD
jgi:hypothetical protein